MSRTTLINKVKTKIDEISPDNTVLVDVGVEDEKPLDEIIEGLLDECAKELLLKAPVHRLAVTSGASATITPAGVGLRYGYITIPADFLRLVELMMTDWKRPVTILEPQGGYVAKRQANKWLRAGVNKPVAILSTRAAGHVIEYYSIDTNHTISRFLYIKKDVAENIPSVLVDSLCWICASKVLSILGKSNQAKEALENAISLMQ